MGKTPSYVKDAVKAYRDKNEFIQVRVDKGTKEIIKKIIGESGNISAYCNLAIMAAIESDISSYKTAQNSETDVETETAHKSTSNLGNAEIKANEKPQKDARTEAENLAELQAIIDAKRAEQEWSKTEKAEKEENEN